MIYTLSPQLSVMIQCLLVGVTIGLGLLDLQTARVPNQLNVLLFAGLLVFGFIHDGSSLSAIMANVGVTTALSLLLFRLGVLGGGDCKYLIALSPLLEVGLLFQVLLWAMLFFLLGYVAVNMYKSIRTQAFSKAQWLAGGRLPFMWAFVPGLVMSVMK